MSDTNPTSSSQLHPLSPEQLEQYIVDALKNVYDPEIPVNIYDLGLIYEINVQEDSRVHVLMTLTTPGCPVAQTFPETVAAHVKAVPGVADCTVEITWDPPWTMDRLSEVARLQLGMYQRTLDVAMLRRMGPESFRQYAGQLDNTMEHWVEAATTADLTDRSIVAFDYEGTSLIVVRSGDGYYALENLCTHDYTPLDDGTVEDDEIVCPHHGARFCARSGVVTAPPAYEDLRTFPVRVDDERIFVRVDALDG